MFDYDNLFGGKSKKQTGSTDEHFLAGRMGQYKKCDSRKELAAWMLGFSRACKAALEGK